MLNKELKCFDLPKLQKKIVLCLVEHGAMTMTDTNKKIKGGQQTSTNRAFDDLENKKMIVNVDTKVWRGRSFNKYWLSMRGVAFALMNNVNPEIVSKNASLYVKNEVIEMYLKMHSKSHIRTLKVNGKMSGNLMSYLDLLLFSDGELDLENVINTLVSHVNYSGDAALNYFTESEALEILKLIKFPEEYYNEFKRRVDSTNEFFDKLKKIKDE